MSILILFSFCSCSSGKEEVHYTIDSNDILVIYTSHKEEIYKPIIKEFEDRTGIYVEVVCGETYELLEEIGSNDSVNRADIMFGGGVDSLNAYEECFEPYISSQTDNLDDTYASKSGAYTVFSKLPIVFIYNTKLVLPSGAPRTWQQMLEYNWRGQIAFADPVKSGSSYTSLSIMIQQLTKEGMTREEVIRDFCENLQGDIASGSSDAVDNVASGNKMVGIVLEETALKRKNQGADIEIMYPKDATCAVPDGCAIIKGTKHPESAQKFVDFIIGDDVQHLLEDQLCRRSVRTDFDSSEVPYEVNYDCDFATNNRREIIALWEEHAGP